MRAEDDEEFSRWLLEVGNATMQDDKVIFDARFLANEDLITDVFGDNETNWTPEVMIKRCVLTPKNKDARIINDIVTQRLPTLSRTFFSVDSVVCEAI